MQTSFILNRIWISMGMCALFVCGAHAENPSISDRLEQLERNQEELYKQVMDKTNPVKSFLNDEIYFGGFLDSSIQRMWGPDTNPQASVSSHWFGLNAAAKFNSHWRFNSQLLSSIGYATDNPNSTSATAKPRQFGNLALSILLAQGYAEYIGTPGFNVQMGLGYVPFGIAFQQREPVLFRRRGGPLLLVATSESGIGFANPLWSGFHIHGSFDVLQKKTGYNVYTFMSTSYSKAIGLGARVWVQPLDSLIVGASVQDGKRSETSTYTTYGADAKLTFERWAVTMEYAKQSVRNEDPWTAYVEPEVAFFDGELVVYGAVDYVNNTVGAIGATSDPYEVVRYGGGINWLPTPFIRYRLGLLKNDYLGSTAISGTRNRDYYSLDLSVGVAF